MSYLRVVFWRLFWLGVIALIIWIFSFFQKPEPALQPVVTYSTKVSQSTVINLKTELSDGGQVFGTLYMKLEGREAAKIRDISLTEFNTTEKGITYETFVTQYTSSEPVDCTVSLYPEYEVKIYLSSSDDAISETFCKAFEPE